MNKQVMLGLGGVVIATLVLGIIFFNPFAVPSNGEESNATPSPENSQQQNQSLSMSFFELMQLGETYSCQFTSTDDSGTTDGTVYIAEGGDRFRGDFDVMPMDEDPTQAHMIRDGQYSYMWSSEQEQGVKMRITSEDEAFFMDSPESEDTEGTLNLDAEQEIDFDCQPWSVDTGMFVPPAEVTFVDYTEQMKQFQEAAGSQMEGNGGGNACAACEQIPDADAQAQCRSMLGC